MAIDVRQWLIAAGFEQYTDAFSDNEIDWDVLPELDNEDLKDLGVDKLGQRKKLLAAIATVTATTAAAGTESDQKPPESALPPPTADSKIEAEYRQLTVMFCDLVGSTELSRRIDAEELRKVISSFQKACVEAVEPLGGFVARFMGDGVLVYFGYPKADENDAENAVAAGLAVVESCERAASGSVRVGIATGRVIVGDLLGSGPAEERAVVGETPNLAARLQSMAEPDSVVVSDTTRRLAGGGFNFTDLGQHQLKGYDENVSAWGVVGVRQIESRFDSNRGPLNPLVGRKTEIMLLADRWQLACGGEGQAVFVSGEAGIGKSRLVEGLRHEVANSKHISLRYQCSPHYSTSALYPVILQLQRAAHFEPDDSADTRLDKIEALLKGAGTMNPGDAQLFAHLMSIPFESRYGELTQSPQQIRARTFEMLITHVLALAERDAVLFIVEDTHWIDPASAEFLELIIGRMQQSRVLLVVTHRPAWRPNLLGYNNISSLQLNRLGKANCATIVRAVAGDFVADDVIDRIVSRTDGIPLFIEELTKSLVEGGLDIAEADIPPTLQASLLARIDRLGPQAKEIIQIGAVIGREVPLELLEAVAQKQHNYLAEGLWQLVQSELLFQSGSSASKHYSFKHALVQDSVYDSMLSETRRSHHMEIAAALVDGFLEAVDTAPELVAHHFTEAGATDQAIAYWHRAGKRSAGRSADAESVAQLERAIKILDGVEESPESLQKSLALHIDLTGPLIAIGGYSSVEMEKNTQRALDLAEMVGETNRIFPILYGRFVFHLHTGHVNKACDLAGDFLTLAEKSEDHETIVQGHRLTGFALLIAGQPELANTHLQKAAAYVSPEHGGSQPFFYGQDIEAAAKVLAAWARYHCGYPEQAVQLVDQAIQRARQLDHANTLGVVLFHGGNIFVSLRLKQRVTECLQELESLNDKHELLLWRAAESLIQPGLMSLNDEFENVIESVGPALYTYTEVLRMNIHTPFMLGHVATAWLGLNQPDDAITQVSRALSISKSTGGFIEDADLLRILANARRQKKFDKAEINESFTVALHCAQEMKNRWYELRICTDHAQFLASIDESKKARALLQPVVDSFTEGHEMPDMLIAKQVLVSLPD